MKSKIFKESKVDVTLWRIMLTMIIIGIFAVVTFSAGATSTWAKFLSDYSTGMLVAGAFFTAGGLGGFLFGIPNILQTGVKDGTAIATKSTIKHNDNLIEISDWLTKIIVGVGLTQLYKIPGFILNVGNEFQYNFGGGNYGRNAAIAVILYFLGIGFFLVYIWTRVYFVGLLKKVVEDLDPISTLYEKLESNKRNLEDKLAESELTSKIDKFEITRLRMVTAENNFDGLKEILKIAKPKPIIWLDDAQKDRWGGLLEADNVRLEARFSIREEDMDIYSISLVVKGINNNELTGQVYFFLHESFMPNHILTAIAKDNEAAITIESYEACTVGVICNGGNTKLEIDLNTYPESPEDYRYKETLVSINELIEERNKIRSDVNAEEES